MTDELKKADAIYQQWRHEQEQPGKFPLLRNMIAAALRRQSIESRNEALEEAARLVDQKDYMGEMYSMAANIRSLKLKEEIGK